MAVTLTTSYQKISTISLTYGKIYTYAKYTSQNKTNKTTTYKIKSVYSVNTWFAFDSATAKLDGTSKSYGYTEFSKGKEYTIQELTRTLQHNEDGSSPTKSIKTEWSATYGGSGSATASIVAPKIILGATITDVPRFNDENGPTIYYDNPDNYDVKLTKLKFLTDTGTLIYEYTFDTVINSGDTVSISNIADDLRQRTINDYYYYVDVTIISYSNGTAQGSNTFRTDFNIVHAYPIITVQMIEQNNQIVNNLHLSSSGDYLINNASSKKIIITTDFSQDKYATYQKGSVTFSKDRFGYVENQIEKKDLIASDTPNEYYCEFNPSNYNLEVGESLYLLTYVFDTRNNTNITNVYRLITYYDYTKVDTPQNPTVNRVGQSSSFNIDANIVYDNNFSVSSYSNDIALQWQVEGENVWHTIPQTEYDKTQNPIQLSYTIDTTLSGNYEIDYTKSGNITLRATDIITSDEDKYQVLSSLPTFDAGKTDFNINGELYVSDQRGNNQVDLTPFRDGDVYDYTVRLDLGGFISTSTTAIYTTICLPKLIGISDQYEPTITGGDFTFRGINGYIQDSGNNPISVGNTGYEFNVAEYGDNMINIQILKKSGTYSDTSNNRPVGIMISNLQITFSPKQNQS